MPSYNENFSTTFNRLFGDSKNVPAPSPVRQQSPRARSPFDHSGDSSWRPLRKSNLHENQRNTNNLADGLTKEIPATFLGQRKRASSPVPQDHSSAGVRTVELARSRWNDSGEEGVKSLIAQSSKTSPRPTFRPALRNTHVLPQRDINPNVSHMRTFPRVRARQSLVGPSCSPSPRVECDDTNNLSGMKIRQSPRRNDSRVQDLIRHEPFRDTSPLRWNQSEDFVLFGPDGRNFGFRSPERPPSKRFVQSPHDQSRGTGCCPRTQPDESYYREARHMIRRHAPIQRSKIVEDPGSKRRHYVQNNRSNDVFRWDPSPSPRWRI